MKTGTIATKKYTASNVDQIVKGDLELPNFEPLPMALVVSNIASTGHGMTPRWGYSKHKGRKQWTQYFLLEDGSGYVLIWNHDMPITGRFWMCKHDFVADPGGNPSRGWRPGHCSKCGLDMSVDSGD